MNLGRMLSHFSTGPWTLKRHFSTADFTEITEAIRRAELQHSGEIRFCVEAALTGRRLLSNMSASDRAREVFATQRVWDTAHNNGVLIYLLLADKDFEIVADRAASKVVPLAEWEKVCAEMESQFRSGHFLAGVKSGINRISALLKPHFPAISGKTSELPDTPSIL
jgi:uncharacterized membrane protein